MSREAAFEKPAWSEYQAYHLGGQETLRKIINLLED